MPTNSLSYSERLRAFADLGTWLESSERVDTRLGWADAALHQNAWFTPESVARTLGTLAQQCLHRAALEAWLVAYPAAQADRPSRDVGVVMAGNVPAVGFHDALCVLLSGHRLLAKLSTQDTVLMQGLLQKLVEIEPRFAPKIQFAERLNTAEAVIATGSDNSARYFEYYFGQKPHLIRRNRTGVGVLRGGETTAELLGLGDDILAYFGLGCRNVSKLYVPDAYDFSFFYEAIEPLGGVMMHHKYHNNYDYNKSVMLVNRTPFLDNEFLMLTENPATVSPLSVVHVQRYGSLQALGESLAAEAEKIQCIVSAGGWWPASLSFGTAQRPGLADYADGVDTLAFLLELP